MAKVIFEKGIFIAREQNEIKTLQELRMLYQNQLYSSEYRSALYSGLFMSIFNG